MSSETTARPPRLGILWFVQSDDGTSRFVELSEKAEDVPLIGGFRTLDIGHVDHWKDVAKVDPSLRGVPYEAYPRGRANYRESDDTWLLLLDRKLLRQEFVDIVVEAWSLPRDRLKVTDDPHYKSSRKIGPPKGEE